MRTFPLIALALALALALPAYAATPNKGNYNRDRNGVSGPILPMEDYTNKQVVPVSGTVTMTCPDGTSQFATASAGGADYEVRRNGNGAACLATSSAGNAGTPRPGSRGWVPGTANLTFCAVSGTTVYLSCWAY